MPYCVQLCPKIVKIMFSNTLNDIVTLGIFNTTLRPAYNIRLVRCQTYRPHVEEDQQKK